MDQTRNFLLIFLLSQETRIQTVNMESTHAAHAVTPSAHAVKRFRRNGSNKFNDTKADLGRNNKGWHGQGRQRGCGSSTCLIYQLCQ